MAAAKLLTNMSSSMNSLEPWGWTNPIFSRDIHGFHVQIKRLPSFTSHLLCQAILWQYRAIDQGKAEARHGFYLSSYPSTWETSCEGGCFSQAEEVGTEQGHTQQQKHMENFWAPMLCFVLFFPFFLSFYSFVSYHEIVCVKKFFATPSSSLWLLEQGTGSGQGSCWQ